MQLTARHLAFSASFAVLLALLGSALATYSSGLPGHPLGQVYTGTTARVGVDDGLSGVTGTAGDGKIDQANLADDSSKLGGAAAASYVQSGCTSLQTTLASDNNDFAVNVPTPCLNGLCKLVFIANNAQGSTAEVYTTNFYQDSTSNMWSADGARGTNSKKTGKNGASADFIFDSGYSSVGLLDDATETSATQFTVRDKNANIDTKLLLCS